jgi:hypothetical protein
MLICKQALLALNNANQILINLLVVTIIFIFMKTFKETCQYGRSCILRKDKYYPPHLGSNLSGDNKNFVDEVHLTCYETSTGGENLL